MRPDVDVSESLTAALYVILCKNYERCNGSIAPAEGVKTTSKDAGKDGTKAHNSEFIKAYPWVSTSAARAEAMVQLDLRNDVSVALGGQAQSCVAAAEWSNSKRSGADPTSSNSLRQGPNRRSWCMGAAVASARPYPRANLAMRSLPWLPTSTHRSVPLR
jgi:hypothetical protein